MKNSFFDVARFFVQWTLLLGYSKDTEGPKAMDCAFIGGPITCVGGKRDRKHRSMKQGKLIVTGCIFA